MKKLKKQIQGFTIIEVMIVLAIAGLIMAIVFVAVPALERKTHNTQRQSDATHLAGIINDYASNHAGTLPTGFGTTGGTLVDISGENWSIMVPANFKVQAAKTFPTDDASLWVDTGFTCNPATDALTPASTRDYAIAYRIDTSSSTQDTCVGP